VNARQSAVFLICAVLEITISSKCEVGMASAGQLETLDVIQGSNFLLVKSAIKTLEPHKLQLAKYSIIIVRDKDFRDVIFIEKTEDPRVRRNFWVRERARGELSPREIGADLSSVDQREVLDRINGTVVPALDVAAVVFHAHITDMALYKIEVFREGTAIVVIYTDKDAKAGGRGKRGTHPGFEVEINSLDMSVRRSNFVR
jgi:hypothetical protein